MLHRLSDQRACSAQQRRGITLFEMMLVIGLLIAMTSLAWPAIDAAFESARLRSSADDIRAALSNARMEAMRTGVPHEFRYEVAGGKYRVRSWGSTTQYVGQMGGNAAAPATTAEPVDTSTAASAAEGTTEEFELPERITFYEGQVVVGARGSATASVLGVEAVESAGYSPPIILYPDGTTSDAVVYLKNEQDVYIRIALRGLTGLSRKSETLTFDEMTAL